MSDIKEESGKAKAKHNYRNMNVTSCQQPILSLYKGKVSEGQDRADLERECYLQASYHRHQNRRDL